MKPEAQKHYEAALAHKEAGNETGFFEELKVAMKADPESAAVNYAAAVFCADSEEWESAKNFLVKAIIYNSQRQELEAEETVMSLRMLAECAKELGDDNLAYAYLSYAMTLHTQLFNNQVTDISEDLVEEMADLADEVDMTIVQHYIFAMQTSFPEPNSIKPK